MNTIGDNLENLYSLWRCAGENVSSNTMQNDLEMSLNSKAQWPNKIWLNELNVPLSARDLEQYIKRANVDLSFPVVNENSEQIDMLEKKGFRLSSELIGMSLKPGLSFDDNSTLILRNVNEYDSAKQWSIAFQKSFGYQIDTETILRTSEKVSYLLGAVEGKIVGTVALFSHKPAKAGIHSMGIVPDRRRNGYAEMMFVKVLNLLIDKAIELVTLQASGMGAGLYLKYGFQKDFTIKNFTLTKHQKP